MTKFGIRDSVLILTLVPTIIIGIALGGYFTHNRYAELDDFIHQQGLTIIEPLAIAAEFPLRQQDKVAVDGLLTRSQNRHSPLVRSIALFRPDATLLMTSNYHRDFDLIIDRTRLQGLMATKVVNLKEEMLFYTPVFDNRPEFQPEALGETPPLLGYLVLELNKSSAIIGQQRAVLLSVVVLLLAMILSMLLAIRLSKMISEPMEVLLKGVERLSEGKEDSRLDTELTGEFDELRSGLCTISEQMRMQRDEMQHLIDQATEDLRETLNQMEEQNIQLNMARREALEASKVKSDFLAKMSHELRTPLNGVIGFTRQLYKTPLNKHQKDYLDTIELSANSLLTIISDILDFSKLEVGAMELERIQFQLRDVINEVLTLLAPSAHEKQLELSIAVDVNVPDSLMGDPTRIKQVLINLISNAIKFTEQGSVTIDVSHRVLPDSKVSLLLSVNDTGVGIAQEKQDTLFNSFTQADSSITRKFGGTGLGLIITKHLVEAMGGEITLNSALGSGTCFTCNLILDTPLHDYQSDLPVSSLAGKRILFFEQHEHTHSAILALLTHWQAEVVPCYTQDQLEQAVAEQEYFDICLIGHIATPNTMPILKGYINAVRAHCDYVYLMLNTVSHNMREALVGSGADACLSKPINHKKLCEVIAAPYRLDHPDVMPLNTGRARLDMKVLVVDDNDANLKLISTLLGEQVKKVEKAHNGAQALGLAKTHRYDLIFMDIQMPIMDGVTACSKIQESSLNEDTPIIAVTAHALSGERENLINVGFRGYLTKPLDEDMLRQAILDYSNTVMLPAEEEPQEEAPVVDAPFTSAGLDWKLALERAGNKPDLAKEMLNMLLLSLPEATADIQRALDDRTASELLSVVHKFHGACCYTGVPKLKRLAEVIETQLKQSASLDDVEPEVLELVDEMENLMRDANMLDAPTT